MKANKRLHSIAVDGHYSSSCPNGRNCIFCVRPFNARCATVELVCYCFIRYASNGKFADHSQVRWKINFFISSALTAGHRVKMKDA